MPDPTPDIPIFDADGALSREFLLNRGYCCENGCRNCPYGFKKPSPLLEGSPDTGDTLELPPEQEEKS